MKIALTGLKSGWLEISVYICRIESGVPMATLKQPRSRVTD